MIRPFLPLLAFGFAGIIAIMVLGWTVGPALVGALLIAGMLLAMRRWDWLAALGEAAIGRRGPAGWPRWAPPLALFAGVALVGVAPMFALIQIGNLAAGAPGASTIAALFWGAVTIAETFGLAHVFKGSPMSHPLLSKIKTNRAAFEAFASETARLAPLQPIDPAQLRAAVLGDVIGQDEIVADVCEQLATSIDLAMPGKPLGVVLFAGATGAGKTELAKSIANHAFAGRLIRIDCNELTESHGSQRLIGAPPGYIGSEEGGQLTRGIEQYGSGVILLDEIEKAHEAVLRVVMGLLDEGRLTEASTGRTADASRFLIVLTTNANHEELADIAAKIADPTERRRAVKDTLRSVFRAEQLGRINDVYCFGRLDRADLAAVAVKFVDGFARQAGVEVVDIDGALIVDAVTKHERMANYGIREVIELIRRELSRGLVARKKEGFAQVAIACQGDSVQVVGIDAHGRRAGGAA